MAQEMQSESEDNERGRAFTVNNPERQYVLDIVSDHYDWRVAVEARK